jgi:hypothetical protein
MAMKLIDKQARELVLSTVEQLLTLGLTEGRIVEEFDNILEGFDYPELLYDPDETLLARIADYNEWLETQEGEDPGKLMEEIAYLAFRCLRGRNSMKSFQSYGPQHDLVVSGSSPKWNLFMRYLHLPLTGRTILVEAKNLADSVSDSQFSRLCAIIHTKYREIAHLGVFFTRNGASGFPTRPDTENPAGRQRSLKNARATQVIFHAMSGKFVIVLDDEDLQQLVKKGALPRILEAKIRDVEEASGLSLRFDGDGAETDLPSHLSQYLS